MTVPEYLRSVAVVCEYLDILSETKQIPGSKDAITLREVAVRYEKLMDTLTFLLNNGCGTPQARTMMKNVLLEVGASVGEKT